MPDDPYAAFGGAAQSDPYQEFGGNMSVPPKAASPTISPTFSGRVGQAYAGTLPLSSYGNATLAGLGTVARGVTGAVQGLYNTVRHPIETAQAVGSLPSQAAQVPAAIRDINQSIDPLSTYANVAQETAGQGAGQALVAAALTATPRVPWGRVVRTAGKTGMAMAKDIPVLKQALKIGKYWKETASKGEPTTTVEPSPEPAGQPVQVGKLPKESGDPYTGSRVPDNMELVDSTNVTKIGYHPASQTMWVEYRNGRTYTYSGVPKEIYSQAKDAESVGSFIARNVKGRYKTDYRGSVLGKNR